jgi:hypothetical protein
MPADLIMFMKWIGLLETAVQPAPRPHMGGIWFDDGEVPF